MANIQLTADNVRNLLLRSLQPADLQRLLPHLRIVELHAKSILVRPNEAVDTVYFIESGMVSMISIMEDGEQVEVGLVGMEGMVDLSVLFGAPTSALEGLVQVDGTALILPASVFRGILGEIPALLPLLLRYADGFQVQISQSAACIGHHPIEKRLARWILTAHDRVGGDAFLMTQEFMSHMLGVQRPGVTLAIGGLQRAGLIRHRKGTMEVIDRDGLEAVSCECYGTVRSRYEWLLGSAKK